MQWETVIGLEIHTQLATKSKIFSGASTAYGAAPNTQACLVDLGYPGGPAVEQAAADGSLERFKFPVPMKGRDDCNFSFSGLKTAVRQAAMAIQPLEAADVADICAGFQLAACEAVADRVQRAMAGFQELHPGVQDRVLVASGGVAANLELRGCLERTCAHSGFRLSVPPVELCTDNAAMIAWAGLENAVRRAPDEFALSARARWPLDADAEPQPFAGVKA